MPSAASTAPSPPPDRTLNFFKSFGVRKWRNGSRAGLFLLTTAHQGRDLQAGAKAVCSATKTGWPAGVWATMSHVTVEVYTGDPRGSRARQPLDQPGLVETRAAANRRRSCAHQTQAGLF